VPSTSQWSQANGPAAQAWADLATQLTPAASLARIDAVTARTVTTITVLGTLLTGSASWRGPLGVSGLQPAWQVLSPI
jgi:hypothetical protein